MLDLEPDKLVMRLAAHKTGVLGNLLKQDDHIELGDGNSSI